jgi:hypothetical protein
MKDLPNLVGELIATVIGWFVCMAILSGSFFFGTLFARWSDARDLEHMFGLLSALSVVWLYERQTAEARWGRLNERLDRLWAKAAGLD